MTNVENVMEMDMTYAMTMKMVLITMTNGVMERIIYI